MSKNMKKLKLGDIYSKKEYKIRTDSIRSAEVVVPIIYDIIKPKSIIDVGCGTGTWLKAFLDINNNINLCGIEGKYVEKDFLLPLKHLKVQDLEEKIEISNRYDLALSLEVAEHLPIERAKSFVEELTKLSDFVLFSAATTFQPGDYHVNCQPAHYWRDLFYEHGYTVIDCIRPAIGENEDVAWWYKNNMFLYVSNNQYNKTKADIESNQLDIVSSEMIDYINYDAFIYICKHETERAKALLESKWKRRALFYQKLLDKMQNGLSLEKMYGNFIGTETKVAIWGAGNIGKLIYNEVTDNKLSNNILFFIDNMPSKEFGVEVIEPSRLIDNKDRVDIIIVTTFCDDEMIRARIEESGIKMVTIEEIIEYN